jgi:CO/xanthine dehydrogenase FAD-binding subunit
LLDITRVAELQGITRTRQCWRIGAAATWTDLIRADLPPLFTTLKLAAREVGSVQIQNRATLAGNICNASPAADGVPPLLAMNAQVELTSAHAQRSLPLAVFITGVRKTALHKGEIVSALLIPDAPDMARSAFLKLGSRTHLVISIAMVAAVVELQDNKLHKTSIAVGSCSPVAQRLPALEAALTGQRADRITEFDIPPDLLAPLSPISDVRGSAQYRLDVVPDLIRRTLQNACVGA